MSKIHTSIAWLLLALPLPAVAADQVDYVAPAYDAPLATYYDWTGFYIGAHGGYNWSKNKYNHVETSGVGGSVTSSEHFKVDPSGWSGGFHAGYLHQFNHFVLGAEVGYTFHDADDHAFTNLSSFARSRETSIDDIWNISAKAGYAWDRTLGYVKAGYANTEVTYTNRRLDTGAIVGRSDDRVGGFIIGAGVEHALTDNWILGAEYSFTKFDVNNQQQHDLTGQPVAAFNSSNHLSSHNVNLRLSYKF